MGSSYFGEPNLGSERASGLISSSSSSSSASSSSSRKGKKNNSEKPKQPQRGLGVAQLEKIRLHGQIDCGYPPPPPPPLHHPPYPTTFNSEMAYSSIPSSSFSYSSSSSSYSPSYSFHPNIAMGLPEYERTNIRYGNSQPTNTARWDNANSIFQTQSSAQPNTTRPFLNLYDSQHIDTRKHRNGSLGSNSQNSESSDTQEPDLELRLSL